MNEFTNENQNVLSLPSVEDIDLHPLQKSYLLAQILSTFLFLLIPTIGCSLLYFIQPEELPVGLPSQIFPMVFGLISAWFLISAFSKVLGFRHKAYGLREKDILYRSGLIWRNETIVPFNRIQHVELGQGPIERLFSLSRIRVFTAGGSQSDLVIPGLTTENAQRIKTYLVNKTKQNGA